jgi:hypothetical protein
MPPVTGGLHPLTSNGDRPRFTKKSFRTEDHGRLRWLPRRSESLQSNGKDSRGATGGVGRALHRPTLCDVGCGNAPSPVGLSDAAIPLIVGIGRRRRQNGQSTLRVSRRRLFEGWAPVSWWASSRPFDHRSRIEVTMPSLFDLREWIAKLRLLRKQHVPVSVAASKAGTKEISEHQGFDRESDSLHGCVHEVCARIPPHSNAQPITVHISLAGRRSVSGYCPTLSLTCMVLASAHGHPPSRPRQLPQ